MNTQTLSFVHRFEPATRGRAPLLLLHGTGGDENDLLPIGRRIAPGAALLSPRGQVDENGMPRFFRRLAEGVFDEEDLRRRVEDMARFVAEARTAYDLGAPIAVGFSNGANIAAALLLIRPEVLSGAVLLRAMRPFRRSPTVRLDGKPILLVSGQADPIIPASAAASLAEVFAATGAAVEHRTVPGGHGLSAVDMAVAEDWLGRHATDTLASAPGGPGS